MLVVSLITAGSSTADVRLPEISSAAAMSLGPKEEYQLGQSILMQVQASLPVIEDALINSYISSLGARLVTAADDSLFPFTFLVVDSPQINAFAAPGGIIVIHSGLILAAKDESELAAVMAHEVAHVTQRHIARMYSETGDQSFASILGVVAAILLASTSPEAAQASLYTGIAASANAQLQFSRDNEQEADRAGRKILADAGYDTRAMNRFFKKLLDTTMVDDDQSLEFLQTHPLPQSRIRDSWRAPGETDGIRDSIRYQYFKARVSQLSKSGGNTTRLSSTEAGHYAQALNHFKHKQPDAASQQLNHIKNTKNLYTELLRAQIALLQKKDELALNSLKSLNQRYPSDPAILQLLAETLITQGLPEQALDAIRPYPLRDTAWLPLLPIRARAEAQSGRQINSHESMAIYYERRGRSTLALEQLQLALKLAPPNSIAKARLEVQENSIRESIIKKRPTS